jgi:uncharacterized protein YcfJ
VLLVGVAACAQQRPVLYPNAHYERVGREAAEVDVDSCMRLADAYVGNTSPAKRTAKSAAVGAAVGSAVGASVGAVRGRPGRGAAAGAAGGGTAGVARGILGSRKNDPIFQRYVEQCLRHDGYETIGWR